MSQEKCDKRVARGVIKHHRQCDEIFERSLFIFGLKSGRARSVQTSLSLSMAIF